MVIGAVLFAGSALGHTAELDLLSAAERHAVVLTDFHVVVALMGVNAVSQGIVRPVQIALNAGFEFWDPPAE